jgi:two pore calcium channel protein
MTEVEAPLITEVEGEEGRGFRGSASAGGSRSGLGNGVRGARQYHRRLDALAYGDRYQKAAALVDLVGSRPASHCSPHSPLCFVK